MKSPEDARGAEEVNLMMIRLRKQGWGHPGWGGLDRYLRRTIFLVVTYSDATILAK